MSFLPNPTQYAGEVRTGFKVLIQTLVAIGDLLADREHPAPVKRWIEHTGDLYEDGWLE